MIPRPNAKRDYDIWQLVINGYSRKSIGRKYRIIPERVRQVANRIEEEMISNFNIYEYRNTLGVDNIVQLMGTCRKDIEHGRQGTHS